MKELIIALIVIAVLYTVVSRILRSPKVKGIRGESKIRRILKKLPKDRYTVLNNIILKTPAGTTQIDHIVVSVYNIFVIETKNFSGSIYGSENSERWRQYLGKKEFWFFNPIRQNYAHVQALSENLGLDKYYFVPIVVFTGQCKLKVSASHPVLHSTQLLPEIMRYTEYTIGTQDVKDLSEMILRCDTEAEGLRADHVERIRKKVSEREQHIEAGICPQCGGILLTRSNSRGRYVVCSHYPNCRYSRKI